MLLFAASSFALNAATHDGCKNDMVLPPRPLPMGLPAPCPLPSPACAVLVAAHATYTCAANLTAIAPPQTL